MEKWLLVYNCQAPGLKNCIQLLSQEVEVEAYVFSQFQKVADGLKSKFDQYDKIIVAPKFANTATVNFSELCNVMKLPPIFFDAYHPDLCYITDPEGRNLKGPLGDYHSLLAYCGYQLGVDRKSVIRLFNAQNYQAIGWLDLWKSARDRFLSGFEKHGITMTPYFNEWGRQGAFMHTVNHPAVNCIRDVAKALLAESGMRPIDSCVLPHDNLLNSAIFPVYPEIGEVYGVSGSYNFKINGEYRFMTLEQMIEASYDLYDICPNSRLSPGYEGRFDSLRAHIEGLA